MTKRSVEALLLCVFFVLAVLLYYSTASYPKMVQGSTANYVRFLGLALGFFVAVEAILWVKHRRAADAERLSLTEAPVPFWSLLAVLVVYATSLPYIGFFPASAIFLSVSMYLLGERRKFAIAGTTVGVLLFIYLVFDQLLAVPLPEASLF